MAASRYSLSFREKKGSTKSKEKAVAIYDRTKRFGLKEQAADLGSKQTKYALSKLRLM
jgi:hypothetical protein